MHVWTGGRATGKYGFGRPEEGEWVRGCVVRWLLARAGGYELAAQIRAGLAAGRAKVSRVFSTTYGRSTKYKVHSVLSIHLHT
jgi:hypothetical protein